MGESLKEYISISDQSSFIISAATIQILFGSLEIVDQTRIYDQQIFISASDSVITIVDSTLSDTRVDYHLIVGYNSKFVYRNVQIVNVTHPQGDPLIFALAGSGVEAENLTFGDSDTYLFLIQDSSAKLDQVSFNNIEDASSLIEFRKATEVRIDSIQISTSSSVTDQYFIFKQSEEIEIKNTRVSGIKKSLIKAEGSTFNLFQNLTLVNSLETMEITDSVILNMTQ